MRADARKYAPGFGQFLRAWRAARGLGQADLSRHLAEAGLSISDSSISDMERRDLAPPELRLRAMVTALGEDSGPWLEAAGYNTPGAEQDQVAESGPQYRVGGQSVTVIGAGNVIELVLRVDRRTGKVEVESRTAGKGRRRG